METPYRAPGNTHPEYKIIFVNWLDYKNWHHILEDKLNEAAKEGWRPILYSEGGNVDTVILERYPASQEIRSE